MPSTPITRRHRLVLAGAAFGVALAGTAVVVDRQQAATLSAAAFGEVELDAAHVGTVYNIGIGLSVKGPRSVRLLSASARHMTPGLRQLDARLGYYCDDRSHYVIAAAGADLMRSDAPYNISTLGARRVLSSSKPCWFLLVRFVPTAIGTQSAESGEVAYKIGFRTYRRRFALSMVLHTTKTGPDPREIIVR